MKKLIIIFLLLPLLNFSQQFIPFGEDSIYRASGWWNTVTDIFVDDTVLYIGGGGVEYGGGGVLLNEIGKWDGNNWNSLDNGFGSLSGEIYCIQEYNNKIYAGGSFLDIQGIGVTKNIGRFNGTTWEGLPNSYGNVNNVVYDMVVHDNKLIIGGGFTGIGGTPLNFYYIAAYNDTDYINIGSFYYIVLALEVFNGELYAGGAWSTLKKYVGGTGFEAWEDVGGNFNYYIQDMMVDTINNFLYVNGGFQIVDDTIPTDNVAIWDGFKWSSIGYGAGEINQRTTMALYRGDLYCNTSLDTIAGVYTGRLAKWDGTDWSPAVPGGINFAVVSLEVFNDMLWIGGGGPLTGSNYCPMDTARKTLARWYLPPATNCKYLKPRVQTYEDTFYVNQTAQFYNNNAYVQTWSWDFGDSGTANIKDPLHTYTDTGTYNVCVTVNDTGCIKTACKTIFVDFPVGKEEINKKEQGFKLYPNPTSTKLFVEIISDELLVISELAIIDIKGKKVLKQKIGSPKTEVDISTLPTGVYFVKIGEQTVKFVKE